MKLKEIEEDISLPAVNYDRVGSSSKGFASSPVEKRMIRIMDARHEADHAICKQIDAEAAVTDLISLLDDPDEMSLMFELFQHGNSIQRAADHLRISTKTLRNRKTAALDHLEDLIQNNKYAAELSDTLKHIDDSTDQ